MTWWRRPLSPTAHRATAIQRSRAASLTKRSGHSCANSSYRHSHAGATGSTRWSAPHPRASSRTARGSGHPANRYGCQGRGKLPAVALGRRAGQPARLRLDSFPWTQYGSLATTVSRVASEVRDGRVRVELTVASEPPARLPLQHGLRGGRSRWSRPHRPPWCCAPPGNSWPHYGLGWRPGTVTRGNHEGRGSPDAP